MNIIHQLLPGEIERLDFLSEGLNRALQCITRIRSEEWSRSGDNKLPYLEELEVALGHIKLAQKVLVLNGDTTDVRITNEANKLLNYAESNLELSITP